VVIESHTRIGQNCTLFQFAVVGGTPQDRKYDGEVTWCEIGHRNHIREHVTIHRGTGNGGGLTKIGNENLVMVDAHLAHDVQVGDRCTIANNVMVAGHVVIEDDATLAGAVGVHHYVTIGRGAFIAGMARVENDVPPYMTFGESSKGARFIPNITGMKRHGFSETTLRAIREVHRVLWGRRSERRDAQLAGHGGLGGPGGSNESLFDRIAALRTEFAAIQPAVELLDAYARSLNGVKGRAHERHRRDDKHAAVARTAGAASVESSA
ncbi:MAG: acyl-ACP--UDP-N-acetylglucosamine O-acyltransferase, partial [Phycisphaerae bacterium]|nr:acyl-ACP--UDP-N-acetylglucosamine O-acyltransferase [Phycisphaerae bacterium]